MMSDSASASTSKLDRFVARYRQDHRHPVNHVLHIGVGWPLCALAVLVLPFRPLWSAGSIPASCQILADSARIRKRMKSIASFGLTLLFAAPAQ